MNPVALSSGIGLLALGAILLLWGAEVFMERASALATRARLPVVAVGLLLAGAEPEELVTAITARADGHPVLAATDALGANVTMITLGLGLALLVGPARIDARLRGYALLASGTGLLAAAVLLDGRISVPEAVLLLVAYVAAVVGVWRLGRRPPAFGEAAELHDGPPDDPGSRPVVWALIGLLALTVGGALAVDGAAQIASRTGTGTGERVTGLTILAFATSAEVLALVVAARRRRLTAVALAGVLGSLVYNATLTLGAASLAGGLDAPGLTGVAVVAALLPLLVLVLRGRTSQRIVGGALAIAYAAYLGLVLGGEL